MDGKSSSSRRSSRRKANRRKTRRSSLARLDDQLGPARSQEESVDSSGSGEEQQDLRDQRRAEGEGMLDDRHRADSEAEDEYTSSGSGSGEETELSRMEGKDRADRDEEDLRRSEGEGMLYDAATLEEEQTPRPGKFDTRVEVREGRRLGVTQAADEKKGKEKMKASKSEALDRDEEDLRRSEGEGMLYDATTLEEEQEKTRAPKSSARGEVLDRDEEDLRRAEGEGMLYYAATLEEEQTPRPGKFDTRAEVREGAKSESDKERTKLEEEPESEEEAYERLKREAEEEQRQRELQEQEEERARQAEAEAEELRLKMARDWKELERQREEEERKSREKVEELMRVAESEAERKQREMKEAMKKREATEKKRREHEIDQLVTRQSLEIVNRRDDLRRSSVKRMGPVKWVPDEMVAACQSCQTSFTLTRRRHHCRACGKIFCAKCSSKEARVRWYEEPERVCDACFLYTKGDFEGKVVLMSGANTGVAAEVAEEMARQGAILAILSPEPEEASALAHRIKKATGNTEVMPLWADFGSLDSVNEAVERFRRQFEHIDVLINNCDVDPRNGREVHTLTHDGNEKLFSIKYLSHFLVTYQLLDLLKLSTPSRVINVCPKPDKHTHVNFDDLQMEHRWSVERATEQSRLGIYCLTRELGLRLKGSGVAVNVLDLGHVYASDQSLLSRAWCNIKGDTPDELAKNAYLYMAASPLTQEVSRGCFLPDGSPTLFRDRALDDAFCAHFYRASYDLVAKWVARDDRGMMEGRVMESALAERIREATREREELRELEENEKLEIDVGSDLDESVSDAEQRRRKGKSKVDVMVDQRVDVLEGGATATAGVKPQLMSEAQVVGKDSRGRTASSDLKKATLTPTHVVNHDKAPHAARATTTQSSLELW